MPKSRRTSHVLSGQDWTSAISKLRHRSNLSQSVFGKKFHFSAMECPDGRLESMNPPLAVTWWRPADVVQDCGVAGN